MKLRAAIVVLGCMAATGCGSSETAAPEEQAAAAAAAAQGAAAAAQGAAAAAAAQGAAAAAQGAAAVAAAAAPAAAAGPAIALAGPGFTATPVHGTAGGPRPGDTLAADCIGNFPLAAQHTVTVGAAIPMLRVLVNGGPSADTTLAVRRPDGTYACNDDSGDPGNSLNPLVEIANAAPGEYQILVGGYSMGDSWASYNLTFNEAAGTFPSTAAPNP